MKLNAKEIAYYRENGYLKLNGILTDNEVKILYDEIPKTIERGSPRIILEDNGSVRSIFAPHMVNTIYNRLARLRRFIAPVEQLLTSTVYLYQYKINTKQGLKGDWWEWHQDFPYWNIDDNIKRPDLVSVMIYLQDTDALNGALLVIPKSHQLGIVKFADKDSKSLADKLKYKDHHKKTDYLSSLNSNIKFTIDHQLIKELSSDNGIVTVSGKKGTILFFHSNIFHASNINITPFDRDAIIITYNSTNNLPGDVVNPRPEFLVGRNYEPIQGVEFLK